MKLVLLSLSFALLASAQVTLQIYQQPGMVPVPPGGTVSNTIVLTATIAPSAPTPPAMTTINLRP